MIKLTILFMALAVFSSHTYAEEKKEPETAAREPSSLSDDDVSAVEAFTAAGQCSNKFAPFFQKGAFIRQVKGNYKEVSGDVSTKTYEISFYTGGFLPGPPAKKAGKLVIVRTITQPPKGMMDAPARVSWSCSSEK